MNGLSAANHVQAWLKLDKTNMHTRSRLL